MSISQIVEGSLNNLFKKEEELFKKRIQICRECPLILKDKMLGEVCNSSLYLNVKDNTVSRTEKDGYVNGCGCILGSKTRVPTAHCPANKC